jgi:hypothetical protein
MRYVPATLLPSAETVSKDKRLLNRVWERGELGIEEISSMASGEDALWLTECKRFDIE